jgi:sporulation protein YlmC with PRC-barrel domain
VKKLNAEVQNSQIDFLDFLKPNNSALVLFGTDTAAKAYQTLKICSMTWKQIIIKLDNVSAIKKYYIVLDHRQHSYLQG